MGDDVGLTRSNRRAFATHMRGSASYHFNEVRVSDHGLGWHTHDQATL